MTFDPRIEFNDPQAAPANWDVALVRFLLEIVRTDAASLELSST